MKILWFRCDEIIPGALLAISFILFWLGVYFGYEESSIFLDVEPHCRMAEAPDDKMEAYRMTGRTAFILGYTGETGKRLVKQLAKDKLFSRITLIGRRQVDLNMDELGPEFEQRVVKFEHLNHYEAYFKGHDVAFCCLGSTIEKAGSEGFQRVEHDYVLKAASLAKAGGTKHFQYMSADGADRNTTGIYYKTKGLVEEALKVMHFQRLSIFRPAVLMVDREEYRGADSVAQILLKPVTMLFPTAIAVPVDTMVQALINNVITPTDKYVEVFENKQIHIISGRSRHCKHSKKKQDL